MVSRTKYRAKMRGIEFNLTPEDITIPTHCPVLGMPLVSTTRGRRGYFPDSPSIDRVHPDKGYVRGNVRVISARANLLKNDATVEELQAVLSDLRRIQC
jgi:hypothetical protein